MKYVGTVLLSIASACPGAARHKGEAEHSGVHSLHQGMWQQPWPGGLRPCCLQEDDLGAPAHEAQPGDLHHHDEGAEGGLQAPPGPGCLPGHAPCRSDSILLQTLVPSSS